MSTGCLNSRSKQKGFVLLSVLLVTTLLLSAAAGYAWFARSQMRSVIGERTTLQARSVAYIAVQQVSRGLLMDRNDFDSFTEDWFGKHIIPIGSNYIVSLSLSPLDDKIPLNDLFLPDGSTERNEIKVPWEEMWIDLEREDMAAVVLDFVDRNRSPRLGGVEEQFFANRPLADLSELLSLRGITPLLLYGDDFPDRKCLENYITVWSDGKININTAPAVVLVLFEGIDSACAEEIVERRKDRPFRSLDELKDLSSFLGVVGPKLSNILSCKSVYFRIMMELNRLDGGESSRFEITLKKGPSKCEIVRWEEI